MLLLAAAAVAVIAADDSCCICLLPCACVRAGRDPLRSAAAGAGRALTLAEEPNARLLALTVEVNCGKVDRVVVADHRVLRAARRDGPGGKYRVSTASRKLAQSYEEGRL
jgi:hypothetical protein